ncbi:thiamine-phosphate kinase [Spirochaetota bacterium]
MIKSELKLIGKISKLINSKGMPYPEDLVTGIGDDCAVYKINDGKYALFTTDISIESSHFITKQTTPQNIGYKAMTSNISDIAAMGGVPKLAFVSMGIPEHTDEEYILSVYEGMVEAAGKWGTVISGGDTSGAKEIVINIMVYGECQQMPILRNGANTGDTIYVTGTLGDSLAGMGILNSKKNKNKDKHPNLVEKHNRPQCRIDIAGSIVDKFSPTAMIDISDGLLTDLGHICLSSKKGFSLYEDKLPVSEELKKYLEMEKGHPGKFALFSGEEYELLFTSSKKRGDEALHEIDGIKITPIGEIVDKKYYLISGEEKNEIEITGFDHFSKKNI